MALLRKSPRNFNYTSVPNGLITNANLSWGARGVMAYLLWLGLNKRDLDLSPEELKRRNIDVSYIYDLVNAGYLIIARDD